jgi:hypothetical protein
MFLPYCEFLIFSIQEVQTVIVFKTVDIPNAKIQLIIKQYCDKYHLIRHAKLTKKMPIIVQKYGSHWYLITLNSNEWIEQCLHIK